VCDRETRTVCSGCGHPYCSIECQLVSLTFFDDHLSSCHLDAPPTKQLLNDLIDRCACYRGIHDDDVADPIGASVDTIPSIEITDVGLIRGILGEQLSRYMDGFIPRVFITCVFACHGRIGAKRYGIMDEGIMILADDGLIVRGPTAIEPAHFTMFRAINNSTPHNANMFILSMKWLVHIQGMVAGRVLAIPNPDPRDVSQNQWFSLYDPQKMDHDIFIVNDVQVAAPIKTFTATCVDDFVQRSFFVDDRGIARDRKMQYCPGMFHPMTALHQMPGNIKRRYVTAMNVFGGKGRCFEVLREFKDTMLIARRSIPVDRQSKSMTTFYFIKSTGMWIDSSLAYYIIEEHGRSSSAECIEEHGGTRFDDGDEVCQNAQNAGKCDSDTDTEGESQKSSTRAPIMSTKPTRADVMRFMEKVIPAIQEEMPNISLARRSEKSMVAIRPSSVGSSSGEHVGWGLFATVPIKKGKVIDGVQYIGRVLPMDMLGWLTDFEAMYIETFPKKGLIIDASDPRSCLARYINSYTGTGRRKNVLIRPIKDKREVATMAEYAKKFFSDKEMRIPEYVQAYDSGIVCHVIAVNDILAGEELLTTYGGNHGWYTPDIEKGTAQHYPCIPDHPRHRCMDGPYSSPNC
jgi:hypothetical protein